MINKNKIKRIVKKAFKKVGRALAIALTIFFVCYFVNNVIYGKLIWENAYKLQNEGDWRAAVDLYDYALKYYSSTSFIKPNRDKYISVQYRKAVCYLALGKTKEADSAIKQGLYLIGSDYGTKSVEYAQYVREHVVDYYLKKKDFVSAKNYLKLAEYFYLKLQTNNLGELVMINRLYGDLYMQMERESVANKYYKNAYRIANRFEYTSIEELIITAQKMGEIYSRAKDYKQELIVYTKLFDKVSKGRADKSQMAYANWLLGSAYSRLGKPETAITYYEEAYSIINKLPDNPEYFNLKAHIDNLRTEMVSCYSNMGRFGSAAKLQKQIKLTDKTN